MFANRSLFVRANFSRTDSEVRDVFGNPVPSRTRTKKLDALDLDLRSVHFGDSE